MDMTTDATTANTNTEIVPTPEVIDANLILLLREITTNVATHRMSDDAVGAEVEVVVATHRVPDDAAEAEVEVAVVDDPCLPPLKLSELEAEAEAEVVTPRA